MDALMSPYSRGGFLGSVRLPGVQRPDNPYTLQPSRKRG
jgi:hypothetical protein